MIRTEIHGGDVAVIVWDLPGRPVNVMNVASSEAFKAATEAAIANPAIKGIVIASAKSDFVVGADLDEVMSDTSPEALYAFSRLGQTMLRRLETCKKPFVAALNGSALGGGLEIALACHHRIASRNSRAIFGLPEVTLGLLPGAGGTQRLPRLLGVRKALPLLLEGLRVTVDQAFDIGIIDEIVDPETLLDRCIAWIRASRPEDAVRAWDLKGFRLPGGDINTVSAYSIFGLETARMKARTGGNYPAPLDILASVYEGCQTDIDSGLKAEASHFAACGSSTVSRNLTRTSFFAVADAAKLRSRPKGVPKTEFKTIGVLGADPTGISIAQSALRAGLEVVLFDPAPNATNAGGAAPETASPSSTTIRVVASCEDLRGCDLVIDCTPDGLSAGVSILRQIETIVGPGALIASNTWRDLAGSTELPDRAIGLRFAGVRERARLVQVVQRSGANEATAAKAMDFAKRIGKIPLLVADTPGRYVDRVIDTYVAEGLLLLRDGVKAALIENAARQAGMPKGPLALADEISLTVLRSRLAYVSEKVGRGSVYTDALAAIDVLERAWESSTNKAFYELSEQGMRLWPELDRHFAPASVQPNSEIVKTRLLTIQALEAARCVEQEVVASGQDADVGAVLGWGFPSYLGGTISMIHTMGIAGFVDSCKALAKAHGGRFAPCELLRRMQEQNRLFYAA